MKEDASAVKVRPCLRATYRVQLFADFSFDDVVDIAAYLASLGISHLYASPYLQAERGSTHGYDVIDHNCPNEFLGGAAGHARFCAALRQQQLGQVLDIVPNHMSIRTHHNAWWWDVLENGPASRYARYFDVEWDMPEPKLRDMVTLPILGDHYGRVLEKGELKVQRQEGKFTVCYYDKCMPVAPRSLDNVLASAAVRSGLAELAFIADCLGNLPLATDTDRRSIERRHRDKEVLQWQLTRLCHERPEVATAIDHALAELNGDHDMLDRFLNRQNYRLAFWKTARRDLGYRRFFDINTLVGLNTSDEEVFRETHALTIKWVREGLLDGLRVDHPDGLSDPEEYFARLAEAAPEVWIVAEKILEPGEPLPITWRVAGTTGYDFLNRIGQALVDEAGEDAMTELYATFTGETTDFEGLVHEKKHLALRELLGSDVNRLTSLWGDICERHRRYRDYSRHELHQALREAVACFPVYRSYVRPSTRQVSAADEAFINKTITKAKKRRPDLDELLFDFLKDLLLWRIEGDLEAEFVRRFQQLTGPVMAKGVEDTAFYCYHRLICLNEVGGNPGQFGASLEEFHRQSQEMGKHWPETMLATSTHDTKRSEDTRARLALLAEIPKQWGKAIYRWAALNEPLRRNGFPDRNAEYMYYQSLVGAWPLTEERALAFMEKATREAKMHTSWTNPNATYDLAIADFVKASFHNQRFIDDLTAFVQPLLRPAWTNSLCQTLVKLTNPGIPDIYQGTELWNYSLVDPDNRRPVDYNECRRVLDLCRTATAAEVWAHPEDGRPKLWLTNRVLTLRKEHPEWFGPQAYYEPVWAKGAKVDHVLAFRRGDRLLTVVPRFPIKLGGDWADTVLPLPAGRWRNWVDERVIANDNVTLADALADFPVALFVRLDS